MGKFVVSEALSDGGEYRGGGDRRLEIGGLCSGMRTADSDLRWVPPGSKEVDWEKLCQGQEASHRNDVVAGIDEPQVLRLTGYNASTTVSLSASPTGLVVKGENVGLGFQADEGAAWSQGLGVPIVFLQWHTDGSQVLQIDGRLWWKDDEQRRPEKDVFNAQLFAYAVVLGWSMQQGKLADSVFRYICLSNVTFRRVVILDAAWFTCPFSEFKCIFGWTRAFHIFRSFTMAVFALVGMMWNVLGRRGEGMNGQSAKFLVADVFSVIGFGGCEVFSVGLMTRVLVLAKLKARHCVGQVRIIILSLFSGIVHAVHIGLDICLFSVNGYTVLLPANHGPVQCVWNHCSSSGWSGNTIPYYHDDCGSIVIIMIIGLLEDFTSRILIRNHFSLWILFEAYLAAGQFVKASSYGSYPSIWVYKDPSLIWALWTFVVRGFSCCYLVLFLLFFSL